MQNEMTSLSNLATNLRTTDLGVTFTTKLFTDPYALSTNEIANVLKSMGVNIPRDVQITAQVAQTLIVGGYSIDSAKFFQKGSDGLNSASVTAIASVLHHNNVIDTDAMHAIAIGMNVGQLIASAGTDVSAWVSLAMNVMNVHASGQAMADQRAFADIKKKFTKMADTQTKSMMKNLTDFSNGEQSVFGFVGRLAYESPLAWPQMINDDSPLMQMFPDLKMMPFKNYVITGKGSNEKWANVLGKKVIFKRWSSTQNFEYSSIQKMNKEELSAFLFEAMLLPSVGLYAVANSEMIDQGNMSIYDLAIIAAMSEPGVLIGESRDYVNFLTSSRLTPYDFGDPIMQDISNEIVAEKYQHKNINFVEQGVASGLTKVNQAFSEYNYEFDYYRRGNLIAVKDGSIEQLIANENIKTRLLKYMTVKELSFEKEDASLKVWREVNNFYATMQMLNTFRTDPFLRNTKFTEELMPFMPSVDEYDQKFRTLYNTSILRQVEKLRLLELSHIINVDAKNIKQITTDNGEPTVITINRG